MEIERRKIAISPLTLPKCYFKVVRNQIKSELQTADQTPSVDTPEHMLWPLNSIDFLILAVKLFAKFIYRLSSLTARGALNEASDSLICYIHQ